MAVTFRRGQELGRGDIDLFLTDANGNAANPAEITFSIYYVDPGPPEAEVLIGPVDRVPANPQLGEFYAPLLIPSTAQTGTYRIRWRFRKRVNDPYTTVVQEWAVLRDTEIVNENPYTEAEFAMISRLRILLRDNCFVGGTRVKVRYNGEERVATLAELYGSDFTGLEVESVSPDGAVSWKPVLNVSRILIPSGMLVDVHTEHGVDTMTDGHRVFVTPTQKVEARELKWTRVLSIIGGALSHVTATSQRSDSSETMVYDLTVGEHHNFVLHDSKMVVSNSPDRNYRFMPPEHEGDVGAYNRVFGYVWEDYELLEYLRTALDDWNSRPPETEYLRTLNDLLQRKPVWKTPVLWGAIVHAMFALTLNWSHERFSLKGCSVVSVLVDGEWVDITIQELYEAIYG
jgi:hypothetical protein